MSISDIGKYNNALYLTYNEHKASCQTALGALTEISERVADIQDYMTEEMWVEMVDKDSIWELQIYPHTCVGFVVFYDSTYEGVCRQAKEYLSESGPK